MLLANFSSPLLDINVPAIAFTPDLDLLKIY